MKDRRYIYRSSDDRLHSYAELDSLVTWINREHEAMGINSDTSYFKEELIRFIDLVIKTTNYAENIVREKELEVDAYSFIIERLRSYVRFANEVTMPNTQIIKHLGCVHGLGTDDEFDLVDELFNLGLLDQYDYTDLSIIVCQLGDFLNDTVYPRYYLYNAQCRIKQELENQVVNEISTPPAIIGSRTNFESLLRASRRGVKIISRIKDLISEDIAPRRIAIILVALNELNYLYLDNIRELSRLWYDEFGYRATDKALQSGLNMYLSGTRTKFINKYRADINLSKEQLSICDK